MTDITAPEKIQKVLDEATSRGLEVKFTADERADRYVTVHSWTISSPLRHDHDAVFIYWTPGARGGRVRYVRYTPHTLNPKRATANLTKARARSWVAILGDSVARSKR